MQPLPTFETVSACGTFSTALSYHFSAKYTDGETSLVYYGYRYYQLSIGKWCSKDPMEERGGLNLYEVFNNNPITYVDRNGFDNWSGQGGENVPPVIVISPGRGVDSPIDEGLLNSILSLWRGYKLGKDTISQFGTLNDQYTCCVKGENTHLQDYDGCVDGSRASWTIAHRIYGCRLKEVGIPWKTMQTANYGNEVVEFILHGWSGEPGQFGASRFQLAWNSSLIFGKNTENWGAYVDDTYKDMAAIRKGYADGTDCWNRYIPKECGRK